MGFADFLAIVEDRDQQVGFQAGATDDCACVIGVTTVRDQACFVAEVIVDPLNARSVAARGDDRDQKRFAWLAGLAIGVDRSHGDAVLARGEWLRRVVAPMAVSVRAHLGEWTVVVEERDQLIRKRAFTKDGRAVVIGHSAIGDRSLFAADIIDDGVDHWTAGRSAFDHEFKRLAGRTETAVDTGDTNGQQV